MATKLYVWLKHEGNVGHVSLEVGDDYVSFWPEGDAGKRQAKLKTAMEASYMPGLHADIRAEGRKPDEVITFDRLNEEAMIDYWVSIQSTKAKYQIVKHNCSHVVAACLECGSGTKPTFHPAATEYGAAGSIFGQGVWTPEQVLQYARELKTTGL